MHPILEENKEITPDMRPTPPVPHSSCLQYLSRTLTGNQKKEDFKPKPDAAVDLDRPTPACICAVSLVEALIECSRSMLQGSNLQSLLATAGMAIITRLDTHLRKFDFSPMGALRLKRDFAEYTAVLRDMGHREVTAAVEDLAARVNLLLVAPDSLAYLAEADLRMTKREALK